MVFPWFLVICLAVAVMALTFGLFRVRMDVMRLQNEDIRLHNRIDTLTVQFDREVARSRAQVAALEERMDWSPQSRTVYDPRPPEEPEVKPSTFERLLREGDI